jgi:tetratricopeptide (TPR) repeat protein
MKNGNPARGNKTGYRRSGDRSKYATEGVNMIRHICVELTCIVGLVCSTAVSATGPAQIEQSCDTLRSLARICIVQGDYQRAADTTKQALALANKAGASDVQKSLCQLDLAVAYRELYRLSDAENACNQGIDLQKKSNGTSHPNVAFALQVLATIHKTQGKYSLAKDDLGRALTILREYHDADDPAIASFYADQAEISAMMGNLSEAQDLYEKATRLLTASYGANHLYTNEIFGKFGALRILQGQYAEAEKMISRCVEAQTKTYGKDNIATLSSNLLQARIYRERQEYDKSQALLVRIVTTLRAGSKTSHPLLGRALCELAELQIARNQFSQATKNATEAVEILQRTLGSQHVETARAMHILAQSNSSPADRIRTIAVSVE